MPFRKKNVACTFVFILALLLSATTGLQFVNLATANPAMYLPTIEIRSDGTVIPETPFIKQNGDVYTLTSDIPKKFSVIIRRSNIVFDGAGHSIESYWSYPVIANRGLSLESVSNVTVKDVEVTGFSDSFGDIVAENATNCVFLRVTAGVFRLLNSRFNTILESSITTGGYPISGSIDSNNNVFFRNEIAYLSLSGEGNIVAKNNITEFNGWGGYRNKILANKIKQLNLGNNSTYYANDITEITIAGADNLLYANNFRAYDPPEFRALISIFRQPWEEGPRYEIGRGTQIWNLGKQGNFWARYEDIDLESYGSAEKPFVVEAKYYDDYLKKDILIDCGSDNYPLVSPFDVEGVSFKLPDWSPAVDSGWTISILSPQNQIYTKTDVQLTLNVPQSAKWVRYSLDGLTNVTITQNTTITALTIGSHNLTLYVDDPLGNTSPSETINFGVAELFSTVPPTAASAVAVTVACAGLLIYLERHKKKRPVTA